MEWAEDITREAEALLPSVVELRRALRAVYI